MAADPEFRDKLRSLNFGTPRRGSVTTDPATGAKVTELVHEDDGRTAALSVEHGDGRVDARVFARPATFGVEAG